jgi:Tetrahydrodipicolinate N-succinyltransferase N-terminal
VKYQRGVNHSLPMDDLRTVIDESWPRRDSLDAADPAVSGPILHAVGLLDSGAARVAEIIDDTVMVHEWLKRAILLFFATTAMLGAGVILNPSIPVIGAETREEAGRGVVPPWCLVINATRPKSYPGGTFGLPCALIIKRFSEGVRHNKAALNDVLRPHGAAL